MPLKPLGPVDYASAVIVPGSCWLVVDGHGHARRIEIGSVDEVSGLGGRRVKGWDLDTGKRCTAVYALLLKRSHGTRPLTRAETVGLVRRYSPTRRADTKRAGEARRAARGYRPRYDEDDEDGPFARSSR